MSRKQIVFAIAFLLFIGCSTPPMKSNPENTKENVISRIDQMDERPDWLRESAPFRIEDNKVISLGSTTVPSDHRLSAAYRIAQNNAKANIATTIQQKLEFVFQNAEEGTEMGSTQARYIGAEASRLTTSSMQIKHRYWEKVAATTDSGERITQYRVFVTVEMPEKDFKKAIIAATKGKEKRGISSSFSEKIDQQWDSFVKAE